VFDGAEKSAPQQVIDNSLALYSPARKGDVITLRFEEANVVTLHDLPHIQLTLPKCCHNTARESNETAYVNSISGAGYKKRNSAFKQHLCCLCKIRGCWPPS